MVQNKSMRESLSGNHAGEALFTELPSEAMRAAPSADVLEGLKGEDRFIAATWGLGHDGSSLFYDAHYRAARFALGPVSESLEYRQINGMYSRQMDRIFNSLMMARDNSKNITEEQKATVSKVFSYLRAQGYKDGIPTNDVIRIARRKQGSDVSEYLEKRAIQEEAAKKKAKRKVKKIPTTPAEILRERGYKIYSAKERNKYVR